VLSHGNHSEILENGSAIIVFPQSDLQCSLDWVIERLMLYAVVSRVDVLRLSEYLTVCMCVFMSRRGMGKEALGRIPSSDS
jgi:hypothetical protein